MKVNVIKKVENIDKNKNEILNNLLKKLLDQKLTRLEKRHKIENKNITEISNSAQNLIMTLENTSNNVRKQIYSKRQILINNAVKLPKNMKILKITSGNKLTPKRQNKYQKLNQIDIEDSSKKNNTERNRDNAKSAKKRKNNKDENKYFNTISNNSNKTGRISNITRRPVSPFITSKQREEFNRTTYNKYNKNKKTPIRVKKIEKNSDKNENKEQKNNINKNNDQIDSTKKLNKEKPQTNINQKNINKFDKLRSLDNYADNEILGKDEILNDNDKNNINLKNITQDNENNKEILPEKKEKCNFLKNLSKEILKDTIKIDDKLVEDSLLVKHDFNDNTKISIDDLIRGPTFTEEIIDENLLKNDDLQNNKDKINDDEKEKKKKELRNSSIAIYNKLKRTKITFLEGEHDFDLIFKDEKIEDIDLNMNNNNNKDLSLSIISEHTEEKITTDIILDYLEYKDIYNLMLVNKECFKTIINTFLTKTEISIDILQEELNKLKDDNPDINFENIQKKKINLSSNSLRAISLLNSSSGNNILKLTSNELNKKEIRLIYSLYFVATGKKSQIAILDDTKKMEFMQNYFKKNISKNSFGDFIQKELKDKIIEDKDIYSLFKISKNYLDNISPNYYQKINKNIAIFVFIIKDILEQFGIISSFNTKPDIEYILLNAKLQANKAILKELNQIEEYI